MISRSNYWTISLLSESYKVIDKAKEFFELQFPYLSQKTTLSAEENKQIQTVLEELNNLLLYTCFLSPSTIIPVAVTKNQFKEIVEAGQTILVDISKWLNRVFEETWQSTESIFNDIPNNFAWGDVRSSKALNPFPLSRTKLIDFAILLQNQPIGLIVEVKEENEETEVIVKIKPLQEEYLPSGLKLKVTLNPNTSKPESEEYIARTNDEVILSEFSEAPGKQFQVEVSYQDVVITEAFLL